MLLISIEHKKNQGKHVHYCVTDCSATINNLLYESKENDIGPVMHATHHIEINKYTRTLSRCTISEIV